MELAIAIPILILLVSGVIDVGLGLNEHAARLQAIRISAREISRWETTLTDPIEKSRALSDFAEGIVKSGLGEMQLTPTEYSISIRSRGDSGTVGSVPASNIEDGTVPARFIQIVLRRTTRAGFTFSPRNALTTCASLVFRVESGISAEARGPDESC